MQSDEARHPVDAVRGWVASISATMGNLPGCGTTVGEAELGEERA
jgi:hypothetical protein